MLGGSWWRKWGRNYIFSATCIGHLWDLGINAAKLSEEGKQLFLGYMCDEKEFGGKKPNPYSVAVRGFEQLYLEGKVPAGAITRPALPVSNVPFIKTWTTKGLIRPMQGYNTLKSIRDYTMQVFEREGLPIDISVKRFLDSSIIELETKFGRQVRESSVKSSGIAEPLNLPSDDDRSSG